MNCDEIQKLMLEADAQATADDVVRKHLIVCSDCRAAQREFDEVIASLREMEAMQPSGGFTDCIVARLAAERAFRRQLIFAAAAVVTLIVGAWFFAAMIEGTLTMSANAARVWTESWAALDWSGWMSLRIQRLGLPLWQLVAVVGALGLGWLVTEVLEYLPIRRRR